MNIKNTAAVTTPFNAQNLPISDISDIQFDKRTGNLLILSDEGHKILETTQTGTVLSTLVLARGKQHEGLTLDSNYNIIVTSKPNLYAVYTP